MDDHETHRSLPNVFSNTTNSSPDNLCSFTNNNNIQNTTTTTNNNTNNNNTISNTTTSNSHNNGASQNNNNKEQDRFLPIANVGRIMKKVIIFNWIILYIYIRCFPPFFLSISFSVSFIPFNLIFFIFHYGEDAFLAHV